MKEQQASRRVAVIGGGISGLAAAQRLLEVYPALELALFEASTRLGGVLDTVQRDGFLIERSADTFITNVPWAIDLCERVDLRDQLIQTDERRRAAMVVRKGRLQRVPPGFLLMSPTRLWPLMTSGVLSPWGKLRLLADYFVPARRGDSDESLASFARRRLGREAFERLVQPLVGGIYAADPEKLSISATLPRFVEMERRHGSLIRAARRDAADLAIETVAASGARYGLFVAPREGLASLVAMIAARLPEGTVRLGTTVESIERADGGRWRLSYSSSESTSAPAQQSEPPVLPSEPPGLPRRFSLGAQESSIFDAVIIAIPAPQTARLLWAVDRPLADDLQKIVYAGATVVALGYRREQIADPLDSFGFVVPAIEKRRILAASFSSVKFAGRAPQDSVLIRVFIGGACQADLADLPDEQLLSIAAEELAQLLGIRGAPILHEIARWPGSMPQYHVGHAQLIERIESRLTNVSGLALAGNAYRGVGIPNCIHSGQVAAERVLGTSVGVAT